MQQERTTHSTQSVLTVLDQEVFSYYRRFHGMPFHRPLPFLFFKYEMDVFLPFFPLSLLCTRKCARSLRSVATTPTKNNNAYSASKYTYTHATIYSFHGIPLTSCMTIEYKFLNFNPIVDLADFPTCKTFLPST